MAILARFVAALIALPPLIVTTGVAGNTTSFATFAVPSTALSLPAASVSVTVIVIVPSARSVVSSAFADVKSTLKLSDPAVKLPLPVTVCASPDESMV